MNKIFSKIATFAVGAAMAIGVGVAASKRVDRASADSGNSTFSVAGTYSGTGEAGIITWSTAEDNITMVQHKGTGSNVNGTYNSNARVYMGNYLHLSASNDYKITKVEIKVDGTYYGQNLTAGTSVSSDGNVTDDTTALTASWTTSSGGTHTITTKDAAGLADIYVQNGYVKSGKQLRWNNGNVKVYFEKPEETGTITSVTVLGPNDETSLNFTEGYTGRVYSQLKSVVEKEGVISSAVTWESENPSIVEVDENGLIKVLANTDSGVNVTATSVADSTKSGSILVKADLDVFDGSVETTTFNTASYGSSNIVSDGTTTFDTSAIAGSGLTNAKIVADKASSSSNPGYYASPASLRCYIDSTITISVSSEYKIAFIDFNSLESNPLTTTAVSASAGSFFVNGLYSYLDCTDEEVSAVTLSFSSQVRFSDISISYSSKVVDPYFTIASDDYTLAYEEVAHLTSALFAGATGNVAFTSSDPDVLAIVDNGDGTATATAGEVLDEDHNVTVTGTLAGCENKTLVIKVEKNVAVTGISFASDITKLEYYVGDELDLTSFSVQKLYSDGSSALIDMNDPDLSFDYDFSAVNPEATVSVTYQSFVPLQFTVAVVEPPAPASISVAEALTAIAALDKPAAGSSTYGAEATVLGYVTSKGSWSTDHNNGDVYIADTKGSTTTLQIFRFGVKDIFDQLKVGTKITVDGILARYVDSKGNEKSEIASHGSVTLAITILEQPEVPTLTFAEAFARGSALTDPASGKSTTDTEVVKFSAVVTGLNWSDQYTNGDIFVSNALGGTDTIDVYRFGDKTVFFGLTIGSEITVEGTLVKYNKSGTMIIEFTGANVTVDHLADAAVLANVAAASTRAEAITPVAGSTVYDTQTSIVTGVVKQINAWNETYKNASVYIGDSVNDDTRLQLYSVGDKDVYDQLVIGSNVTVQGVIAVYKKDSSTAAVTEFVCPVVTINSTPTIDELTTTEALARGNALATPEAGKSTYDSSSVDVTGYIVDLGTWSTQYKNAEIYIAETMGETAAANKIHVYRFGDKAVYDTLEVNAQVKVRGQLAKYNNATSGVEIELVGPTITLLAPAPRTFDSLTASGTYKDTYYVGEDLDFTGLVLTANYSKDPTAVVISLTDEHLVMDASSYDKDTVGDYMVKFTYTDESTSTEKFIFIAVHVVEAPVPATVTFDANGGSGSIAPITDKNVGDSITLPNSDGFVAPDGYEFKCWKIGTTEYAVGQSYTITDAAVTVQAVWQPIVPPEPTLISISQTHTVDEYNVGDTVDKSTLTVTAHYDTGDVVLTADQYTLSYDFSAANDNAKVTVTFGGKSTFYYVTVSEAPTPTPPTPTPDPDTPSKKGCRGDVAATSVILSVVALAGVVLLSVKKRKED